MKRQIRKGTFETNSSSQHSISISIGDAFTTVVETDCEGDEDLYFTEEEVLDSFPIPTLQAAIERRKAKFTEKLSEIPTDVLEAVLEAELKKRKSRK